MRRCDKRDSASARAVLVLCEGDGKGGHTMNALDGRERMWVKRDTLLRQRGDERLASTVFHAFVGVT